MIHTIAEVLVLVLLSCCGVEGEHDVMVVCAITSICLSLECGIYWKVVCCTYRNVPIFLFCIHLTFLCAMCAVLANFTNAPGDVNVTEGEPLSINCAYTNANRISWWKGGVQISSDDVNFDIMVVDASTSVLTLMPSAYHTVHTGEYQCVAMDGSNSFTTNFTVTVQCKYALRHCC